MNSSGAKEQSWAPVSLKLERLIRSIPNSFSAQLSHLSTWASVHSCGSRNRGQPLDNANVTRRYTVIKKGLTVSFPKYVISILHIFIIEGTPQLETVFTMSSMGLGALVFAHYIVCPAIDSVQFPSFANRTTGKDNHCPRTTKLEAMEADRAM